jgi:RND superfamily putative drug exporter
MSRLLQRLGRLSFRRRRTVLAVWIALFLAGIGAAGLAGGSFSGSFSIPGTESQKANDLLGERAPATKGATGRIVFGAPAGERLTGEARATVRDALGEIEGAPGIASVSDPFSTGTVSKDGRVAYAEVRFDREQAALTDLDLDVVSTAADAAESRGLQVGVTGDAAPEPAGGGATEGIGIVVAFVVLLITFGSIVAAGMPLLTAVVGVGIGLTGIVAASAVFDLSSAVISLAAMLGLAVGIDYALFISSRYRALAQGGMPLEAATGQAVGTAGSAVVFAGSTVVVALVALVVTGVPFMAAMGIAAAATVALAVVIAVTLVPALLGFAGQRVLRGKRADRGTAGSTTLGLRWVDAVVRHRGVAIGLIVVVTLALAAPLTHLRLGLPDDASKPVGTPQRTAGDLTTRAFGAGFNGPLTIVAEVPRGTDAKAATTTVAGRLAELGDVASVSPPQTADVGLAIVQVTPRSGPSSVATKDLVREIRDDEAALTAGTRADLSVTGATAVNIDVADRMGSALIPYLAVIIVLAFLLLTVAFRSLLVPLTAVGGFLLSVAAALGAMVGVFQDGFGAELISVGETAPIVSLIPILTVGILFGLAMDYQVFLVSGMREAHVHGAGPQEAVRSGFRHSARVVTAAGLIMVSVFAGFILPDDAIIKSIGFALTVGVLIDTFLVRMTLIPALMSLLGERAWWLPRWLDRLLPNVDIEGANLERHEGGDGGAGADADAGDDGRGTADEDRGPDAGRVTTGRASA